MTEDEFVEDMRVRCERIGFPFSEELARDEYSLYLAGQYVLDRLRKLFS